MQLKPLINTNEHEGFGLEEGFLCPTRTHYLVSEPPRRPSIFQACFHWGLFVCIRG
jgi:hypothetical protein